MPTILQISVVPDDLNNLAVKARKEGVRFVDRLVADFDSGINTFSNAGEALFEARIGSVLVGVGGLNRDPYTDKSSVGRVRHLYVEPEYRRVGIARLLIDAIERAAQGSFSELRLRTDTAGGIAFYSRLGYAAVHTDKNASHSKRISSTKCKASGE